MALGQEHVPQAELAGLGFELFEDCWVGIPSLFALTDLGLEQGLSGNAFFFDKFLDLSID